MFYGVHISPKFLALAENLVVEHSELLLDGFPEPYQLPKESAEVVQQYFNELKEQKGLDLDISSLVLADTTTPKGFEGKKILNPTGLNEKLKKLSELTTEAVNQRGVKCDSLYFLCTDSDSPHRLPLSQQQQVSEGYPLTPGLTKKKTNGRNKLKRPRALRIISPEHVPGRMTPSVHWSNPETVIKWPSFLPWV